VLRSCLSLWRRRRPSDVVIAVLAGGIAAQTFDLAGDGSTLYQVAGGCAIGLLAFVVTPVATLLTLSSGERATAFNRRHRPTIIKAMTWAFLLSLCLFGFAVAGGALDGDLHPRTALRWGTVIAAIAATLAVARLFWFFVAALAVREADADEPVLGDRPGQRSDVAP
jgi:hypothetical protein